MNLVSGYFHEIFINNQLLSDRDSCSTREGQKTSLVPEIENLSLNADAGSETTQKWLNIPNFSFLLSSLLELL